MDSLLRMDFPMVPDLNRQKVARLIHAAKIGLDDRHIRLLISRLEITWPIFLTAISLNYSNFSVMRERKANQGLMRIIALALDHLKPPTCELHSLLPTSTAYGAIRVNKFLFGAVGHTSDPQYWSKNIIMHDPLLALLMPSDITGEHLDTFDKNKWVNYAWRPSPDSLVERTCLFNPVFQSLSLMPVNGHLLASILKNARRLRQHVDQKLIEGAAALMLTSPYLSGKPPSHRLKHLAILNLTNLITSLDSSVISVLILDYKPISTNTYIIDSPAQSDMHNHLSCARRVLFIRLFHDLTLVDINHAAFYHFYAIHRALNLVIEGDVSTDVIVSINFPHIFKMANYLSCLSERVYGIDSHQNAEISNKIMECIVQISSLIITEFEIIKVKNIVSKAPRSVQKLMLCTDIPISFLPDITKADKALRLSRDIGI